MAMSLLQLEGTLARISAEVSPHRDHALGLLVCQEALRAAASGNYGVGAALVDPQGKVIAKGRNQVFSPMFRSDLHAEMVVMNEFEQKFPEVENMRGYTLVSSLEPCPMCVARLLMAGVETVKFLCYDKLGGMTRHLENLPLAWKRLGERQEYQVADVCDELRRFATDVFLLNLDPLRRKLLER